MPVPLRRLGMGRVVTIAATCLTCACATVGERAASAGAQSPRSPNVVFILADDLGWQDVGFMGSTYYETPNIDALAKRGVIFTDAYSSGPNCAPTRAALLSGQWAPRTGVYTVGSSERGFPQARKLIPAKNTPFLARRFVTLAETFKANGYVTASIGKWHVGRPGTDGPQEQGFDVNIAGDARGAPGKGGYFAPYAGRRRAQATLMPGLNEAPEGEYLTDRLGAEAARFVAANRDRPFFLYLPHYAVHTPIEAKPGTAAKWAAIPLAQRQGVPEYAAMVKSLDDAVGRVVAELERHGLHDRTIIVFTSDNGGASTSTTIPGLRGAKGMLYEGGIRVPTFIVAPGAARARTVNTPISSIDYYPTLIELAGIKPAEGARLDGRSIAAAVRQGMAMQPTPLFWHLPAYLESTRSWPGSPFPDSGPWRARPAAAIRVGRWKLIENYEDESIELYDLLSDRRETRNLVAQQSATAMRLRNALHAWQQRTGAPVPRTLNPQFDPAFVSAPPGDEMD